MKPENYTERTRRQLRFGLSYFTLLTLLALCSWVSFRTIPTLADKQKMQSAGRLATYRQQLTRTDLHLAALNQGTPIDQPWLRTFFSQADALDGQFTEPTFLNATLSYRRLVAEYEDGLQNQDPELQQLAAQRTDLQAKQLGLQTALAGLNKAIAAAAGGGAGAPPAPPPAESKATNLHPAIFTGYFGPFKPLLVRGSGEFGNNSPLVNASAQVIVVDEKRIILSVYFEVGDNNTFAKTTERYELYAAPPGLRITAVSAPQNTPWRINYTDRTQQDDQFSVADGLFTFQLQANTPGLDVGGPGGSSLTIKLNRPIRIDLAK
ncbi:hypothetical protein J2I47_09115 [Fibrella sp. HMF5335]|uniref:Uncharacterized protein n=1 Tax=Fibrella rubiginis TaxID=2817060 RepID=A0A939GCS2_9BACT|nr:hypothetical protein [Fibrella rubiginis]MBO0936702.1 hypothetical protein [Fibrella rubiginis]